jgi:class 3 adenylate cyclase
MAFRDGTVRQKALFGVLVGLYVFGLLLSLGDKMQRVGSPNIGWVMDGYDVFPVRPDAAVAGLLAGGRTLQINGIAVEDGSTALDIRPHVRTGLGESNVLTVRRADRTVVDVTIPVLVFQWRDVLWAEGPNVGLGALFVAVGVASFLLRPFAPVSWALLALCCAIGGVPIGQSIGASRVVSDIPLVHLVYFRAMVGFVSCVPFHAGLAFPVVHPLLARRPGILFWIYGLGVAIGALQLIAAYAAWAGAFRYVGGGMDTTVLVLANLFFVGRCVVLAWGAHDPVVAQRARILLVGVLFGVAPVVAANFVRGTFGLVVVDLRLAYWSLLFLLLALGYLTVRHDLLNARVTVRRAVIYAAVVGVLTGLAILLVSVRPYAVALMLLPLLYWWPRFNERLNAWLYPKRAQFPDLVRSLGGELAAAGGIDAVLKVLAHAPERLCDARSGVAFLLPDGPVSTVGCQLEEVDRRLSEESLVQLMITTRREVMRDHIAVEPQYANIKEDCYACFDRLHAEALLPLLRDQRVVGGLAIGARTTGDVYETPELTVLATVAQQAVQAIARVEANDRLRAREREFADLKRFFPPQIIDQVMAKGGASELRSQRKLVTVFFADLRGFTSFSDSVEPEEVMATLAEYHVAMGRRIAEFAGTLERFAGDGFMVFFNDPVDQPDHVERAARMALAMRGDVLQLRESWLRKGYQIDVGMGLHTGYATCGFVGYEGRRDYAVIGNVTNLAARLSAAAAGGEVLVTARVLGELPGGYRTEPAGELSLKGFHQPQAAYRLVGIESPQRAAG